jgi:hypothetical protein
LRRRPLQLVGAAAALAVLAVGLTHGAAAWCYGPEYV